MLIVPIFIRHQSVFNVPQIIMNNSTGLVGCLYFSNSEKNPKETTEQNKTKQSKKQTNKQTTGLFLMSCQNCSSVQEVQTRLLFMLFKWLISNHHVRLSMWTRSWPLRLWVSLTVIVWIQAETGGGGEGEGCPDCHCLDPSRERREREGVS